MVEEERNAMIPRPSAAIEKIGAGPRGILSRMVSDALALARSQEKALTAARFRIGNYELRDPDYRQILLWAKALELEPAVIIERLESSFCEVKAAELEPAGIIERLESSFCERGDGWRLTFRVENGSIVTLAWDFDLLPLSVFEWVDGLVIREVGFKGCRRASREISLVEAPWPKVSSNETVASWCRRCGSKTGWHLSSTCRQCLTKRPS